METFHIVIMVLVGLLVAVAAGWIGYQIKAKDCPSCQSCPSDGKTWTKDQKDTLAAVISNELRKKVPQEGISCVVQNIAGMINYSDFYSMADLQKRYVIDIAYNLCLGPKGRWASWIKAEYVPLVKSKLGVLEKVARCIVNNLEQMYSGSVGTPIADIIVGNAQGTIPDEVNNMIKGCK